MDRDVNPECRLFVSNLAFRADKHDLRSHFAAAGAVVDVYTPFDRSRTGHRNKGFAFVEMASATEAKRAIELLDGHPGPHQRVIYVKAADAR